MSDVQTTEAPAPVKTSAKKDELVIRPARRDEMSLIGEMVRSSAEWYRPIVDEKDMAEHDVDADWEERNFKLRDFYIATVNGEPVGTVSLQGFGEYAYLGYIYLFVDQVGKGYGQTMMKFAEQTVKDQGMKGIFLIAHPEAKWAQKAYLKFGFEIIEKEREKVLAWRGGVLEPYYEEGFELYLLDFAERDRRRAAN